MSGPAPTRETLLGAAMLALVAIAVYANTLGHEFVYDDHGVLDGLRVSRHDHWGSLFLDPRFFKTLTFMGDYQFWGSNPFGYHLTNILLHGAVTAALFVWLRVTTASGGAALLAGLLFAVHPIHSEVVANIANRKDALATLFLLIALLGEQKGGVCWWRRGGSIVAYALALASKEVVGAALLPLMILRDLSVRDREPSKVLIARYIPYVLVSVLAGGWLLVVKPAGHAVLNPFSLPQPEHLLTVARAFQTYLGLLVFPVHLNADHVVRLSDAVLDRTSLSALALLGVVVLLAVACRRPLPWFSFGLWWMLIAWLPISNLIPVSAYYVAERYFYLPSVGFCLAVASLVTWLASMVRGRKAATVLATMVPLLAMYGWMTYQRNWDWRSDFTLWLKTVIQSPTSAAAHYNVGSQYGVRGDDERAMGHFQEAIRLAPRYDEPAIALAIVYRKQGRTDEAIEQLKTILDREPTQPWALSNLGLAYQAKGDVSQALEAFTRLSDLYPNSVSAERDILGLFMANGRIDEAVRRAREAVERDPDRAEFRSILGSVYLQTHDLVDATEQFQEAVRLAPGAYTYHDLGLAYVGAGNIRRAEELFRRAIEDDSGFAVGHYQLGVALERLGRFEEAATHYRAALKLIGSGPGGLAQTVRQRLERLPGQ